MSAIEDNIKEIEKRVCSLSLAIVENIPPNSGPDLSNELTIKIERLKTTLKKIMKDLKEIKRQKKLLLMLFPDPNKVKVEKCLNRLKRVISVQISHQIRIEGLLEKVQSRLLDLNTQLDKLEATVKPHSSPDNRGRQDMPMAPQNFYGRDRDVADIVAFLTNKETSRVCITGTGGMGKTDLALAVVHKQEVQAMFPTHRFWVPCVEAKSPDLLRRLLYTQLSITAQSYDGLDPLLKELKATEERRLLVLDNFETPWLSTDANAQTEVRYILAELAAIPHVALMVTMASAHPPYEAIPWKQHKLFPLNASAARETFEQWYPGADTQKVDKLMTAVGCTPLAITLMATLGNRTKVGVEDLLRDWDKAGSTMFDRMDRTIEVSVERVKANSEAMRLLAILSLLPAGTTGSHLSDWAPALTSHFTAVDRLRTAALVEQGEGSFADARIFLRPTIQAFMVGHPEYVQAEVRAQVRAACYNFVLAHKSIPDDPSFKDDLRALASEQNNIQGLLMQEDDNVLRPEALVAFSLYLFRTKLDTAVAQHALAVASVAQDHRCVAEAHEVLGKIFMRLAEYEKASEHFEDAARCFKKLPTGADLHRAGACAMQQADTWMFAQASSAKVNSLVSKAQQDLSHNNDEYNVARGLLGLANFLWYSQQRDRAHDTLNTAKRTFEKLGSSASTSECLFLLARTQATMRNYSEALDLAKQALETAEQTGDGYLIGQALRTTARCLIVLKRYDEALSVLQRSLSESRALGHALAIAQNLELLGYTQAARMQLFVARAAYRAGQVQYGSMGSTTMGQDGKARCEHNIRELAGGQPTLTELRKPMLF